MDEMVLQTKSFLAILNDLDDTVFILVKLKYYGGHISIAAGNPDMLIDVLTVNLLLAHDYTIEEGLQTDYVVRINSLD